MSDPTPRSGDPLPPRSGERIAKLLARAGIASRREVERMIADGRVKIGDVVLTTPATVLENLKGVSVDGKPVAAAEPTRLFAFHKPQGLLTAERDPAGRPTIYTALRNALPKGTPRLMPVGRLDLNTEGLLLLTNDGEFKRQLELPSTGVERTYRARTFGEISQSRLEDLIEGIEIDGMRYGKIDANLERSTGRNKWIVLTLTEGKNREVRRVLEHLGLEVSRLIRVGYGPFRAGRSAARSGGGTQAARSRAVPRLACGRRQRSAAPGAPEKMRIIAGQWRSRPLVAPKGDTTRPTADRTRETLFSMLASRLGSFEGLTVADLFAGSGALGLEALSRGAAQGNFRRAGCGGRARAAHQRGQPCAPQPQCDVRACSVMTLGPARAAGRPADDGPALWHRARAQSRSTNWFGSAGSARRPGSASKPAATRQSLPKALTKTPFAMSARPGCICCGRLDRAACARERRSLTVHLCPNLPSPPPPIRAKP